MFHPIKIQIDLLPSVPELYSSHHGTMSHQLTPDSTRLPSSVGSTPTYGLPASVTYPSSLLPATSSTSTTHMNHQVSAAAAVSSSTYQQASGHQLPPTPNSLVTMMGPNSGNSNPASDQLTSTDLPINNSVSPASQQQQQQTSQQGGSSSPSWNLPISASGRVGLPSPPPALQQPHAHTAHPHQAFATHYGAQGFQQPPRPAPHQPFYSWY